MNVETDIVIFGHTGMLGRYVYNVLKHSEYKNIHTVGRTRFDILADPWQNLCDILGQYKPCAIIINCAGAIPHRNSCGHAFIRINSVFPHKLQNYATKYGHKVIHITTDCVFSGLKRAEPYMPGDIHCARDLYGMSKSLGESEDSTIIRTSIIGKEQVRLLPGQKYSFLDWVISQTQVYGYCNHLWNGITCYTLAKIILQMIREHLFWKGIRHIFSPRPATKYELCQYVRDVYELDIVIIPSMDKEPKNMTLGSFDQNIFAIDDIYTQIKDQKDIEKTWNL